ncbi:MAG: hypothetical protein ACRBBS_17740 [Thalassovita sp.]
MHNAPSGERHIADVKTPEGTVIEFQHSHIDERERRAREQFYEQMIWVVDGTRLKRDRSTFLTGMNTNRRSTNDANQFVFNGLSRQITRRWMDSQKLVYLDFGDEDLWCVSPHKVNWQFFAIQVSKSEFAQAYRAGHVPQAARHLLMNQTST